MKRAAVAERHSIPVGDNHLQRSSSSTTKTDPPDQSKETGESGIRTAQVYARPASRADVSTTGALPVKGANAQQTAWLERGQLPSFEFDAIDDKLVLQVAKGANPQQAAWLERGQLPSFEFDAIDDGLLLQAVEEEPAAVPANTAASGMHAETRRQMYCIAGEIQKAMEGDIAAVLKELGSKQDDSGVAAAAKALAKREFSPFVASLQSAKRAASEADPAGVGEHVAAALARLKIFRDSHIASLQKKAGMPKTAVLKPKLLGPLVLGLEQACQNWGRLAWPAGTVSASSHTEITAVAALPLSMSSPGSSHEPGCGSERPQSDARFRSISSPEYQTAKQVPAASVSPRSPLPSPRPPESKGSGAMEAKEPGKATSPIASGKRRLKTLFSGSSAPRLHAAEAGQGAEPSGSPRGKPATGAKGRQADAPRVEKTRD